MKRSKKKVMWIASFVARAGSVRRRIGIGAVGMALSVMLSVAGCTLTHSPDLDGDGFGRGVDCDDTNPRIFPGAFEDPCPDGVDQNCDGYDGTPGIICNIFPNDFDGDGYEAGYDCDDYDPRVNPGAFDPACPDGLDQDCDGTDGDPGLICDPFVDSDNDGYRSDVDCNDRNPNVHPGAYEDPCPDGIDQDCDGYDGLPDIICNTFPGDFDGDGFFEGHDCDDMNASVYPGADEPLCPDGIDQNCDGFDGDPTAGCAVPDTDGDGYSDDVDCSDEDPSIHPGAEEVCFDGIDQNCNGLDDWEDPACPIMNGFLDTDMVEEEVQPLPMVLDESKEALA